MEKLTECPQCYGRGRIEVRDLSGVIRYGKSCGLCEGKGKVSEGLFVSFFEMPDK